MSLLLSKCQIVGNLMPRLNLYVEIYRCQLRGRQFKKGTDANWHLHQGHNTRIDVNPVRYHDFIPAQGEIPRKPSVVKAPHQHQSLHFQAP